MKSTIAALFLVLALPASASALLPRLTVDLEGAGKQDAVVTFVALDYATGETILEVDELLDGLLKFLGLRRLSSVVPSLNLGLNQGWAVRVDASRASGTVRVKKFKLWVPLLGTRTANLHGEDISGTTEWFVIGDQVGE